MCSSHEDMMCGPLQFMLKPIAEEDFAAEARPTAAVVVSTVSQLLDKHRERSSYRPLRNF